MTDVSTYEGIEVPRTDYQATFRMSRDEWDEWQAMAARAGMSTAAWVRQACREKAAQSRGEQRRTPDGGVVLGVGMPAGVATAIEQRAAEHFRSPEFEVLAILAEALKTDGGDK